jgi:uncharacterized Fe-S cluster protein YjdI
MSGFQNVEKQDINPNNFIIMDPKDIKKEYSNGEVNIVWQSAKCIHAAECVKNNPAVFKPREKPWIQPENSTTEAIIETVKKCPSGALTYKLNDK